MVDELLGSAWEVHKIWATADYSPEHPLLERIKLAELERITHLKTPNKVLAVVKLPEFSFQHSNFEQGYSLVLDGVSDPGNLGTIIRTADWFGIENIICSDDAVDVFNPKVVQSTMGSLFRMKITYTSLPLFFETAPKIPVAGMLLSGENIFETTLSAPAFIVLGSESHGISKEVLSCVNHSLTIPGKGRAESLNVAVAAGIVCAELSKT